MYMATFILAIVIYSRRDIYRRREKYRRGTFRRNFRTLGKNFFNFFLKNNIFQNVKNQNIKKKFGKSFFLGPYFKFEKMSDENLPFFSISCSFYTY
jgi:hypothetical protein